MYFSYFVLVVGCWLCAAFFVGFRLLVVVGGVVVGIISAVGAVAVVGGGGSVGLGVGVVVVVVVAVGVVLLACCSC